MTGRLSRTKQTSRLSSTLVGRSIAVGLFVLLGVGMSAVPASATSILVTGNTSFTVDWLYTATNPDLSGSATFTISSWTSAGFNLAISNIRNTTATSPDIDARLTSFGFGLTPDATGFTNTVNGAVYSWGFSNFPAFSQVDVCGFAGNNCAGGAGAGLDQGQSTAAGDIMSIHVNGSFANGVRFDPVPVKFQTSVGSFEFDSTVRQNPPVPEPASLLLLSAGLAGGARAMIRRRRQAAAK